MTPKIIWSDVCCGIRCCEYEEMTVTDESSVVCPKCGRMWRLTWELSQAAPSNNGFHADRASGPDNSDHSPETRPAGEP